MFDRFEKTTPIDKQYEQHHFTTRDIPGST